MKNFDEFYPIDLARIQEKAIAAKHAFEVYRNSERSVELREESLKEAENIISVIVRDIDYYFDVKAFDGKRAKGLDEIKVKNNPITKR